MLRGSSTYTYDGNWKVQAENGADGYHVSAVHWNYAATTSRRGSGESANVTKTLDAGGWGKSGGGLLVLPPRASVPVDVCGQPGRPAVVGSPRRAQGHVRRRQGRLHGDRIPQPVPVSERVPDGSVQHADPAFPADRHRTRPRSPSTASRRRARAPRPARNRIRQYEDFFNASGMATPDDLEEFRSCQLTFRGTKAPWNDMSRGAKHWLNGTERPRNRARHGRGDLVGNQERGRGPVPGAAPVLARDHARRAGGRQPFRLRRIR